MVRARRRRLLVDGQQFDIRRFYRFPDVDIRLAPPLKFMQGPDGFNRPLTQSTLATIGRLETLIASQNSMLVAQATEVNQNRIADMQQRLESDVQTIEEANAQINQTNNRVLPLLETLTGQILGADPEPWRKWWTEQLG